MTTDTIPDFTAQEDEHKAWLVFVDEWRKVHDVDLNDPAYDPLCRAIELWGELLVALRVGQTEDERARARAEKHTAFLAAAGTSEITTDLGPLT